jgi:hypothetical protein
VKDGLSVISGEGTVKGRLEELVGVFLIFKDYTKYPIK